MEDDPNSLKTKLSDLENRLSQLEKELNQVKDNQHPTTFKVICIFAIKYIAVVCLAYSVPWMIYCFSTLMRGKF